MQMFDQAFMEAVFLVQSNQVIVNPQLVDQAEALSISFGDDCDPSTGDGPVFWSAVMNEYVYQYELDEYNSSFRQYDVSESTAEPVNFDADFPF